MLFVVPFDRAGESERSERASTVATIAFFLARRLLLLLLLPFHRLVGPPSVLGFRRCFPLNRIDSVRDSCFVHVRDRVHIQDIVRRVDFGTNEDARRQGEN